MTSMSRSDGIRSARHPTHTGRTNRVPSERRVYQTAHR